MVFGVVLKKFENVQPHIELVTKIAERVAIECSRSNICRGVYSFLIYLPLFSNPPLEELVAILFQILIIQFLNAFNFINNDTN